MRLLEALYRGKGKSGEGLQERRERETAGERGEGRSCGSENRTDDGDDNKQRKNGSSTTTATSCDSSSRFECRASSSTASSIAVAM